MTPMQTLKFRAASKAEAVEDVTRVVSIAVAADARFLHGSQDVARQAREKIAALPDDPEMDIIGTLVLRLKVTADLRIVGMDIDTDIALAERTNT